LTAYSVHLAAIDSINPSIDTRDVVLSDYRKQSLFSSHGRLFEGRWYHSVLIRRIGTLQHASFSPSLPPMPVVLSQYRKQSLVVAGFTCMLVVLWGSLGSTTLDEPGICAVRTMCDGNSASTVPDDSRAPNSRESPHKSHCVHSSDA
jgi:hypothetical protein